MASTAQQIVSPVMLELGEDASDASASITFVNWLSDAVAELYDESSDWVFLRGEQTLVTTSGISSYSLGTLVAEVTSVVLGTGEKLVHTTETELVKRGYDINQSGRPSHYIISTWTPDNGPQLRLWPVPNSSETITVYRVNDPAALTSSSIVELPNATFSALRSHIRASYYGAAGVTDLYHAHRSLWDRQVLALRKKYAYGRDQRIVFGFRDIPETGGTYRDARLPPEFGV